MTSSATCKVRLPRAPQCDPMERPSRIGAADGGDGLLDFLPRRTGLRLPLVMMRASLFVASIHVVIFGPKADVTMRCSSMAMPRRIRFAKSRPFSVTGPAMDQAFFANSFGTRFGSPLISTNCPVAAGMRWTKMIFLRKEQ